ncbi:MAG: VCBS repeat-containing protein, partial [Cyclobacteriaceae bacterium]|nr:VCBS repeat-containing protein [Cyclobacteriaceae bacterium]
MHKKNSMRLYLILPFVALSSYAQFSYRTDSSVPVIVGTDTLRNAWAGGFNAGQFNTMDVNGDGINDIVLYDRMAERVMVFLKVGNQFQHAPQYEIYFPESIVNWMLLRDYNNDGKKDLFTGDVLGIKLFKNITIPGQPPAWQQVLFNTGFGTKSTVLLTKGFSGKVNLQQNFDDMPAFRDVDGDGDLDIFCARYPTGNTIEFHKNFGIERFGTADSLDFERITQTWGNVTECNCGVFAFNGQPCNAVGGRMQHAGGKSLDVTDINNDGHPDLLFSESECSRVYLLQNLG